MELTNNSLTAKLYRWYYNTNDMPSNLCPYFWKLLVMWVTIIPVCIITLPGLLFTFFGRESWEKRLIVSFMVFLFILISFFLILGVIHLISPFDKGSYFLNPAISGLLLGAMGVFVTIFTCLANLFTYLIQSKPDKNISEKHHSIILEFVKAKYHRYCPKINWN